MYISLLFGIEQNTITSYLVITPRFLSPILLQGVTTKVPLAHHGFMDMLAKRALLYFAYLAFARRINAI